MKYIMFKDHKVKVESTEDETNDDQIVMDIKEFKDLLAYLALDEMTIKKAGQLLYLSLL